MIGEEYSETYFKGYKDGWESALLVLKGILARGSDITLEEIIENMENTPEKLLRQSSENFRDEH